MNGATAFAGGLTWGFSGLLDRVYPGRAVKQFTSLPTIAAQVLTINDLQARRLCATENIQRADLTPLEEIKALAELVDASLLLEYGDEYEHLSPSQEPKWRVKMLLTKLDSDRRTGTDYFSSKFTGKVKTIFDGFPSRKTGFHLQPMNSPSSSPMKKSNNSPLIKS